MDIGAGITFGNGVSVTKQPPPSYKAIFGYGQSWTYDLMSVTNKVSFLV
jgi:hypothetical protein